MQVELNFARVAKPKSEILHPRQVRMTNAMYGEIGRVAVKTGLKPSDTHRLALDHGLPVVEKLFGKKKR